MTITTVGTSGRDYSTCKAWADAADATLVAPWEGQCYNDGTITEPAAVSLDSVGDATNFMKLTTAAGQSFADHANKLTNALRPNQANGVYIEITTHTGYGFNLNSEFCIVEKIQINDIRSSNAYAAVIGGTVLSDFGTFRNNIVKTNTTGASTGCAIDMRRMHLVNSAVIATDNTTGIISTSGTVGKLSSCTIVNVSGSSTGKAISNAGGGTPVVDSCATFNWGADNDAAAGSNNNATNRSAFGGSSSSDQVSLTTTNEIESATSGSEDLRAKSTSTLKDNGVRDQTYTSDLDVVGQNRSTTTPTIGCWEASSAGANATPVLMMHYN